MQGDLNRTPVLLIYLCALLRIHAYAVIAGIGYMLMFVSVLVYVCVLAASALFSLVLMYKYNCTSKFTLSDFLLD